MHLQIVGGPSDKSAAHSSTLPALMSSPQYRNILSLTDSPKKCLSGQVVHESLHPPSTSMSLTSTLHDITQLSLAWVRQWSGTTADRCRLTAACKRRGKALTPPCGSSVENNSATRGALPLDTSHAGSVSVQHMKHDAACKQNIGINMP
jgi:hypothetical protein